MKILLISSFALRTPPVHYGGLERVWYEYAKGLNQLGHEVTLIAAKGSTAPQGVDLFDPITSWFELTPEQQRGYTQTDGIPRKWNNYEWVARTHNGWRRHEESAFTTYHEILPHFDVIGDASWAKWSTTSQKQEIVCTAHSQRSYSTAPPNRKFNLTGVSLGHGWALTCQLRVPTKVLWNPVDINHYPFQKEKGERILSFNRIMPTKGIHHFVSLCEKEKIYGDVAGDDSTLVSDQQYVQMIKQRCQASAYLQYHGLVQEDKRLDLLKNAKCLISYKDFGYEEVFGLNLVEAMACGTPVISVRTWGAEDIIEHGKTGFIVDRLEDVVRYLQKIGEINPEDCRTRAKFFSPHNRSTAYGKLLEAVKRGSRW